MAAPRTSATTTRSRNCACDSRDVGPGSAAGAPPAAPRLVWQVGEVQAVDEVAKHREAVLVELVLRARLLLFLFRDDSGSVQDLGGYEDRALEAHGQGDCVARPGVDVQLAPVLAKVQPGEEDLFGK